MREPLGRSLAVLRVVSHSAVEEKGGGSQLGKMTPDPCFASAGNRPRPWKDLATLMVFPLGQSLSGGRE